MNSFLQGVLRPHVSIDVADLAASVNFYRALFATEPAKLKSDYAKFELTDPPLNFSMNLREHGKEGSLNHLGFQVNSTEDVLAAKTRLEASGLVSFDEMDVTCCYAKQDKIWVHDPDGNAWEFFVVTEANADIKDERPDVDSKVNCCVPNARSISAASTEDAMKVVCC